MLPIVAALVLIPAVTAHAAAPTATICPLSSTGAATPGATAEYYSGTWKPFGTTDATGAATRELMTGSTYFRIAIGGQSQTLTQNPGANPVVTFRTTATTVRFLDSTNAPVVGASVEYYAGTWKPLGTTDATGTTTRELITGSPHFRISHLAA